MGSTESFWRASQGVIDNKGGRVNYTQRWDFARTSTTAFATDIIIPEGAVITDVFIDIGVAPTSATTLDLGVQSDTDSIVDGQSLGTTAGRRVFVGNSNFRLEGFDEDTTLWVDFSRADTTIRAALFVTYILPVPSPEPDKK